MDRKTGSMSRTGPLFPRGAPTNPYAGTRSSATTACTVSCFRNHRMHSHPEVYFASGQFHPSTKRPKSPRRPEATSSVYHIMSSDAEHLCLPISQCNPNILPTRCISRSPSFSTGVFRCRLHATTIASPVFFFVPVLYLSSL